MFLNNFDSQRALMYRPSWIYCNLSIRPFFILGPRPTGQWSPSNKERKKPNNSVEQLSWSGATTPMFKVGISWKAFERGCGIDPLSVNQSSTSLTYWSRLTVCANQMGRGARRGVDNGARGWGRRGGRGGGGEDNHAPGLNLHQLYLIQWGIHLCNA